MGHYLQSAHAIVGGVIADHMQADWFCPHRIEDLAHRTLT
jgi:hypothetical protein